METILLELFALLRDNGHLSDDHLIKTIRRHNREVPNNERHISKKKLLPYYLKVKEAEPERWAEWGVDAAMEAQLVGALRVKPRRTSSGVATITVITKPWKCTGDCLYCPNDVRMPKSYLSDEPACQRAERNYFDPYLQVVSRLRALTHMGHPTDKIELIVLGGTWSDYPQAYQLWFATELFRALNDGQSAEDKAQERRTFYRSKGISNRTEQLAQRVEEAQRKVNEGIFSYNQAIEALYGEDEAYKDIADVQVSTFPELFEQHALNEVASRRVVGLVIETRPDAITPESLTMLRRLGCTKVQVGIQSLNPAILKMNNRGLEPERIRKAFELLRIFGFKIHAHFMVNLYGATPEEDKADYCRFVTDEAYLPDEVKLYPCSLVSGTRLCEYYEEGSWRPYDEDELIDILIADTLTTPCFVRISRMIRDISAHDILAGNRKANLRQLVEGRIEANGEPISEIRYREINRSEIAIEDLTLSLYPYKTTASDEVFIQWVTPENKIAGFLRLSLPKADYLQQQLRQTSSLPVGPGEAMIREVHIYGRVVRLHGVPQKAQDGSQHLGLGRQLIKAACDTARARGYKKLNVISSVGTREYYRELGFADNGLYQQILLTEDDDE
ncbi:MAG: tRNA uridine(34) 5-carboxymethylaminomethyl modification radical SAM/GNAT enzyme Elp3 [Coriobacteriales bacterium]|jgi:elongator complex protein 3|nr:tRNA uridine(34) 5-carboxymethylaminomethyl modification radical SAM/GNAT enzyme Elp3 [Coriobacteriales bacterium]